MVETDALSVLIIPAFGVIPSPAYLCNRVKAPKAYLWFLLAILASLDLASLAPQLELTALR